MSGHHHHHHGPPHHHHPPGGPPPYNYPPHVQPPQAPYMYMPAPVVMPMPVYQPPPPEPQPNPTYVTNYIYQQPETAPTPVHVVDHAPMQPVQDFIDWVPSTPHSASSLAHKAVVAGKEPGWNSSPLWIIRAHHNGECIPGKLAITDRRAYIPNAGKEMPVHNFEVLCVPAHMVRWLPASNGQVPVGAIVGGNTHNAEPLYIGRVRHGRSVTPGKVHPSHGCLYIPFGGMEVPHKTYEVLCKIVG